MAMRGVRAWLVTWEWSGEHAKRDEKVAAVLDHVRPLRAFVGMSSCCMAQEMYTLGEGIGYFVGRRKRNPYPAELVKLESVPWEGEFTAPISKPDWFAT